MSKTIRIIHTLLISTLVFTSVALAQESNPGMVTLTGTIGGFRDGYIELIIDEGANFQTYKVYPMEPLKYETLDVGDIIDVSGYFNGEELVAASDIHLHEPNVEDYPQTADLYAQSPAFCNDHGASHPIAVGIAETYAIEVETIVKWVCKQGYSFGDVILTMQTAEITQGNPETLLKEKNEHGGWGRVWVSYGLISNEQVANAPLPPGLSGQTPPGLKKKSKEQPSPPDHAQSPGGPGDDFIPPGQDKDSKANALPENAGPPDGSGPPGQSNKEQDQGNGKDKDKNNKGNNDKKK